MPALEAGATEPIAVARGAPPGPAAGGSDLDAGRKPTTSSNPSLSRRELVEHFPAADHDRTDVAVCRIERVRSVGRWCGAVSNGVRGRSSGWACVSTSRSTKAEATRSHPLLAVVRARGLEQRKTRSPDRGGTGPRSAWSRETRCSLRWPGRSPQVSSPRRHRPRAKAPRWSLPPPDPAGVERSGACPPSAR